MPPYAKPCKYCNTTQVVWDDKLEGPNKFKEVKTGLQHSRDRCDAAKSQKANDFIEGRGYMEKPVYKITSANQPLPKDSVIAFDVLQRLNDKVDSINAGLHRVMEFLETNVITNKDREIATLRQKVTELEEVVKKEGMGMKTAAGERIPTELTGEYVKEMVHEGKEDEELEI
jgi:hypothetical protein